MKHCANGELYIRVWCVAAQKCLLKQIFVPFFFFLFLRLCNDRHLSPCGFYKCSVFLARFFSLSLFSSLAGSLFLHTLHVLLISMPSDIFNTFLPFIYLFFDNSICFSFVHFSSIRLFFSQMRSACKLGYMMWCVGVSSLFRYFRGMARGLRRMAQEIVETKSCILYIKWQMIDVVNISRLCCACFVRLFVIFFLRTY